MEIDKYKELTSRLCTSFVDVSSNLRDLIKMKDEMLRELESLKDYHRRMYFSSINNELSEKGKQEYEELQEHVKKLTELIKQANVRIESASKNKTVLTLVLLDADAIRRVFDMALDKAATNKSSINHWLNIIQEQQAAFEEMRAELIAVKSEIEPEVYRDASNNLEILVKLFEQLKDKFNQLN